MKRCYACQQVRPAGDFNRSRGEKDGLQKRCKECLRAYRAANREHITEYMRGLPAEYRSWTCMKNRCLNPKADNFEYYGGRGITVCERWHDFAAFIADVGQRPGPGYSLDRIDNSKGYEPGNVRWATMKEQCANRRNRRFFKKPLREETQP